MDRGTLDRRAFLKGSAGALAAGGLGLGLGLRGQLTRAAAIGDGHPLAPRPGHHPARAKHLIVFFMTGGMSHVDTFDHKPKLQQDDAKELRAGRVLRASPFAFAPAPATGLMISELFAETAGVAEEFCFVRSVHTDSGGHSAATLAMHTGSITIPLPSLGSWISYGLGTFNTNLPSFVVLAEKDPYNSFQTWDSNFLPSYHRGVRVVPGPEPIPNLKAPQATTVGRQELERIMLRDLNETHLHEHPGDLALEGRLANFDTAYGLMREAPEAFELGRETDETLALYGAKRDDRTSFAAQCLTARRLVERGVRVVELFDVGSNSNWDSHGNIEDHRKLARNIDRPLAALVRDLRRRGLLQDTLILGCTEFGRTPWRDADPKGRGHHSNVFTCFLAGGGVKGGTCFGSSDEYGARVAEDEVHVHDLHATILHLMGLDHTKLTYRYSGRDYRLTDVHGNVVTGVLA